MGAHTGAHARTHARTHTHTHTQHTHTHTRIPTFTAKVILRNHVRIGLWSVRVLFNPLARKSQLTVLKNACTKIAKARKLAFSACLYINCYSIKTI